MSDDPVEIASRLAMRDSGQKRGAREMSGPIVQAGARPKFWLNTDIAHERPTTAALAWSDEKNGRRCELIRRRLRGSISADEQTELEQLQAERESSMS